MTKGKLIQAVRQGVNAVGRAFAYLWRRTRHNFGMKLLSLIFGILLCSVIMTQANPERRVTLNDVKVSYYGLDALKQNNLTLSPEQRVKPMSVTVAIKAPMQEISGVSADRITARLDLSGITQAGEHELSVMVSSSVGSVYTRSPAKMIVSVEELVSRTIPVTLQPRGELAEGYALTSSVLSPNYVTVSGPASLMAKVNRGVVSPDLSQVTHNLVSSLTVKLEDEQGGSVDTDGLTLSTTGVMASLEVKQKVELPVNARLSLEGEEDLADGYTLSSVKVYPETVSVTGPADTLAGISEIATSPINISDVIGSQTFVVNLAPVSGLSYSVSSVEVVVTVSPVMATKTLTDLPVQVINLGPGLIYQPIEQRFVVTVTGPKALLDTLTARGLTLVADAKGLVAGTHELTVRAVLEEEYAGDIRSSDLFVSPNTITLVLEATP